MGNIIMFCILAVVIIASALLCVTTTRIMRAATFMLFVLFGVAGIYFLLDYTYLGAAQISVYAGGVTMIYIFAIQLVSKRTLQGLEEKIKTSRFVRGGLAALIGLVVVSLILLKTGFFTLAPDNTELSMEAVGKALVNQLFVLDVHVLEFAVFQRFKRKAHAAELRDMSAQLHVRVRHVVQVKAG